MTDKSLDREHVHHFVCNGSAHYSVGGVEMQGGSVDMTLDEYQPNPYSAGSAPDLLVYSCKPYESAKLPEPTIVERISLFVMNGFSTRQEMSSRVCGYDFQIRPSYKTPGQLVISQLPKIRSSAYQAVDSVAVTDGGDFEVHVVDDGIAKSLKCRIEVESHRIR